MFGMKPSLLEYTYIHKQKAVILFKILAMKKFSFIYRLFKTFKQIRKPRLFFITYNFVDSIFFQSEEICHQRIKIKGESDHKTSNRDEGRYVLLHTDSCGLLRTFFCGSLRLMLRICIEVCYALRED